jgi:hypothetical protein
MTAGAPAPGPPKPAPGVDNLKSIPDLKQAVMAAAKADPQGSVFLERSIAGIADQDTATLLLRLQTVEHPLIAWALHMHLDARDIPPCLRHRMPEIPGMPGQSEFIATLADLQWIVTRHPDHKVKNSRMRGVFRHLVRDERWHEAALWAYRRARTRDRAYMLATHLALTDAMRCHTLTMPTSAQSKARRALRERLPDIIDATTSDCLLRPDKSGQTTPQGVAARRALFVSTFVLLGRNQTETVECLLSASGVTITRQALVRQLEKAAVSANAWNMVFGSK